MIWLHENAELFKEVIYATSNALNKSLAIVEKDYYVTMILKQLEQKAPDCVFKGGTSLSKCFHAIDRFSEDIDIAFMGHLTQKQRGVLKNEIIAGISSDLKLPIADFAQARSKRDYNCYTFQYQPQTAFVPQSMISGVKMETSLGFLSFPTERLPVDSFVYQFLKKDNENIVQAFDLAPFEMNVQSLERTFADKVFALCDYYLQNNPQRNSRHIYDLYLLLPRIALDENYRHLVSEIRNHRATKDICPSAKADVDVPKMLLKILSEEFYKRDYQQITAYFQNTPISYEEAVSVLERVANSDIF